MMIFANGLAGTVDVLVRRRMAETLNAENSTERGKQFYNIKSHSGNLAQDAEEFPLLLLTCFLSDCLACLASHFLSFYVWVECFFFFSLKTQVLGETVKSCSLPIEIAL